MILESYSVPFHFTVTYLVVLAAAGGTWVAIFRPTVTPQGFAGRFGFGFGWFLLAWGELIHGAGFVPDELSETALVLRASGYALVVLSLVGSKREVFAAAVVVTPTAFMPGFLGLAGAWLAFRSALEDRRWLAFSLLLFAGSEILFGLGAAGSGLAPTAAWVAARLVRVVAAIGMAAWLWQAFKASIQLRFIAVFVVLSLVVVLLMATVMTQVFASNVGADSLADAEREGEAQKLLMDQQRRSFLNNAKQVASADDIKRGVAQRNPSLAELAAGLEGPGGLFQDADFLAFYAPGSGAGALLAYSSIALEGEPQPLNELDATSLAGTGVVVSAIGGVQAESLDVLGGEKLALIGAFPVFNPPGLDPPGAPLGVAGAVVMGRVVDARYLEDLVLISTLDFSVISPEAVLSTTLPDTEGIFEVELRRVFEDRDSITSEKSFGGTQFFNSYVPLERVDGQIVGALVVSSPSEVIARTQQSVGRLLFILVLAASAIGIALSYLSGARVTRPILELTAASQRVRKGNLDERVNISTSDEVGDLGEAFNEMTSSISDLTDDLRASAEEEAELRGRIETILQSMSDGLVAVDSSGEVLAINREANRILGTRKAIGRDVRDVLQVTDSAGVAIELSIYEMQGGAVDGALVHRRGETVPVAVTSASIVDDEGDAVGAVAVIRDLTRELEVETLKTEFLSNVSHELRTPITPIKGYLEMMRTRPLTKTQSATFIDTMSSSVERLERVVDMLVEVASMEAGRLALRTTVVNLDKTTLGLVERWKVKSPKHRFVRKGFRGLPELSLDERLFPKAIDELIDNAVKFSPKGGRVTLSATVRGRGKQRFAEISVADEGVGLSEEALAELFTDFSQGDGSATREFGGLGLGLAYIRRIAEAHGGSVKGEVLTKGSVFTIEVPLRVEASRPKKASPPKKKRGSSKSKTRSIKKKKGR